LLEDSPEAFSLYLSRSLSPRCLLAHVTRGYVCVREREEAQSGSRSGFDDDADDYDETAEELVASFATRDYTKPFS